MGKENSNLGLIVTIVIFVMLLLFGGCLFILSNMGYLNFDNDNNHNQEINEDVDKKENNLELPEWANYLLKQNITEITYESGILIYDEAQNIEECEVPKKLSKQQLEKILFKMTEGKLIKRDSLDAGGPCWGGITIKYNYNGSYDDEFIIYMSQSMYSKDNNSYIMSLFEKEKYEEHIMGVPDPEVVYEYNWDTSYIDTLF